MKTVNLQVESKLEPKQPRNAPKKGTLPFPSNVSKQDLDYQPSKVEDLNKILPAEAPRFQTESPHPKVSLSHPFILTRIWLWIVSSAL